MIIDIHAHTSTHKLWGFHTADASIGRLKFLANKYNVERIYLMATYFPLKNSGLSNSELLKRIEGENLFGCFGSLNLQEQDFGPALAELTTLAQEGLIEGIKLYPGYQDIILSDIAFLSLYRLAEKFSLPVAVHMGELHHCCQKNEREKTEYRCRRRFCPLDYRSHLSYPGQLLKAARLFPKVNFIACHLANPYFDQMREAMEEFHNIYTDISGQFYSGSSEDTPDYRRTIAGEIIKFLAITGGEERIMFATDFPVQSYKDTFEIVKSLNLKPDVEKMLLGGNAQKLLPRARKELR